MKQLAVARAVIVLWTQNSIKSDFVRAEAGRAKADGKLIPVKESDVAYGDIPLPFGEMHTEDLRRRDLIRAAVVDQLAAPMVQRSAWWMVSKSFKYEVLTWAGIIGGALTLFSNLGALLTFTEWARWLTNHWSLLAQAAWQLILGWLGIQVPRYLSLYLTFSSFITLTSIATIVKARRDGNETVRPSISWPLLIVYYLVVSAILILLLTPDHGDYLWIALLASIPISLLGWGFLSLVVPLGVQNAWVIFLFVCLFVILALGAGQPERGGLTLWVRFTSDLSIVISLFASVIGAPAGLMISRFNRIIIVLLIIVCLNEISNYAPLLRQLLRPPQ
jgi:hypothetical protein